MMIKKLMILGLVLALPAMVSALSVDLTSGGKSTLTLGVDVAVNDVITVDVTFDGAIKGFQSLDISASGETINAVGSFVHANINLAVSNVGTGLIDNIVANANIGTTFGADEKIYSFQVTVDGVGTVTPFMGAQDAAFIEAAPGYVLGTSITQNALNIIPEPATIALLGLGGLFLRRRK
jgi:hypothetical protein